MTKALIPAFAGKAGAAPTSLAVELVYVATSLTSMRAAIDSGADCIHLNCSASPDNRNRSELCFTGPNIGKGIQYAHDKRCKAILALESGSHHPNWLQSRHLIDRAAQSGTDALVLSDPALMLYAAAQYPGLPVHFFVSDATLSPAAINFFHKHFGIRRAILPRVLSLTKLREIANHSVAEIEVFGFGNLCAFIGGCAHLSNGPAHAGTLVTGISAMALAKQTGPACCGQSVEAANDNYFAVESPRDIGALKLLPQLVKTGIHAVRIEGYGRDAYHAAQVTRVWRQAVDQCAADMQRFVVKPSWISDLAKTSKVRRAS